MSSIFKKDEVKSAAKSAEAPKIEAKKPVTVSLTLLPSEAESLKQALRIAQAGFPRPDVKFVAEKLLAQLS